MFSNSLSIKYRLSIFYRVYSLLIKEMFAKSKYSTKNNFCFFTRSSALTPLHSPGKNYTQKWAVVGHIATSQWSRSTVFFFDHHYNIYRQQQNHVKRLAQLIPGKIESVFKIVINVHHKNAIQVCEVNMMIIMMNVTLLLHSELLFMTKLATGMSNK